MIEHKLAAITKLLLATKESMTGSWKAMIEEDRLLTRIDILERQLETSHKVKIYSDISLTNLFNCGCHLLTLINYF